MSLQFRSNLVSMKKKYFLSFCFVLVAVFYGIASYSQSANFLEIKSSPSKLCRDKDNQIVNITVAVNPYSSLQPNNNFTVALRKGSEIIPCEFTIDGTPEPIAPNSTTYNVNFNVKLPETISGTGYQFVVSTTAPVASTTSTTLDAYFIIFDKNFIINELVSEVTLCAGSSYTLSVTNTKDETTPLQYPQLKYNWYKGDPNNNPTLLASSSNPSYLVSSSGSYFAKVDYGTCTNLLSLNSNVVEVVFSTATATATLTNNGSNSFCDPAPKKITASLPNNGTNKFTWFKDGKEIENQTSNEYTATEAGIYSLSIDNGVCLFDATNIITLTPGENEIPITISPDTGAWENGVYIIPRPEELPNNANVVVRVEIPFVTGLVVTSKYDGATITSTFTGTTTRTYTYTVTKSQTKEFTVEVNQPGGCGIQIIKFIVGTGIDEPPPPSPVVPNTITPNGDGFNDKWRITDEFVNKDFVKIQIIDPRGKLLVDTTNYQNDWPADDFSVFSSDSVYYYIIYEDNVPVKQGSITVLK
jgi:gliding motility-associated-like protein